MQLLSILTQDIKYARNINLHFKKNNSFYLGFINKNELNI